MQTKPSTELSQFAADVLAGLSASPKFLSSKYFYDDEGSRLFQEIMKLPEYYLTACENEIFTEQADQILKAFAANETSFDLIELGAGDGTKTAVLIEHFLKSGADITYSPIDISNEALDHLAAKFKAEFPALRMKPMCGDYFEMLESLNGDGSRKKILLFLGSNIGNFSHEGSIAYFRDLRRSMNPNDLLFIGFDLQKDPHVISAAYDDSQCVTAKFNMNLLTRINRELGGNFDVEKFVHYANYRPIEGTARSFLMSREEQTVRVDAIDREFEFQPWEAIFMEISQKYSFKMIEELATTSGFRVKQNFFDSKEYYCDSLWEPMS